MSAFDPKRTRCSTRKCEHDVGLTVMNKFTEFHCPNLSVVPNRRDVVESYECHRRTAGQTLTHLLIHHCGETISALAFGDANRPIEITIGRCWKGAQHSLNDADM